MAKKSIVDYKSLGQFNDEIKNCSNVIKREPRNANAYERRGQARYGLQDYTGAMKDFNMALKHAPANYNAFFCRAQLKIHLGDVAGAMKDYAKGMGFESRKEFGYTSRGCGFIILKRYGRAIADFNRALKINPKFACAYNNRGYCRYFLGDLKESKRDCDMAHSLDKTFPPFEDAQKIFKEG